MKSHEQVMQSIVDRFNSYSWHDSKILDLQLVQKEGQRTGDLLMNAEVWSGEAGRQELLPAQLTIRDCTIIKLDLDLETKAMCSHDIAFADCVLHSAYMDTLGLSQPQNEGNSLPEFLHFTFGLCPPSGEINVIARDFDLSFKRTSELAQKR